MNALETVSAITTIIGVPAGIGGFIYVGRKLQILDELQKSVETIKHNLTVVCNYLTRHHNKFDPKELHNYSPIQLTDAGTELVENLGFDKVFAANQDTFLKFIDQETPRLKYDVETAAIKSIYLVADAPYMEFLKIFFYNHPARNFENTAPTLGVYIRDKYLAEHPEITQ